MFFRCESFNQDLSKWDVSKVIDMRGMFFRCESFNKDLSKWDVSNVTSKEKMFEGGCPIEKKYKPKFKK
jgi:surface protein